MKAKQALQFVNYIKVCRYGL